ncbi:putative sulfate transporter [Spathaspora sp. JA1]|nr:putative sulfate transporter [Spathaspora sp. JA1]
MTDENQSLLPNSVATSVPPIVRYDTPPPRPGTTRFSSRPPLLSVPSNVSLRSSTSFTDPLVESYRKHNHDTDTLSILDYRILQKLNDQQADDEAETKSFDTYAYLAYYIPILNWLPKYQPRTHLLGDTLAGLSLASFQIPLVMSIATSLARLPPISGLYAMIIGSLVYAVLGSVPILIVGPSPSTAIIYGQAIETIMHESKFSELTNLEISSILTFGLSGMLLACGFIRLGYLDNVLSRALLKGFIAAMGLIMIINQLSTELGLEKLSLTQPHITTIDKIMFIVRFYDQANVLTAKISAVVLAVVLFVRFIKEVLINRYNRKSAVYFPELLLMVVVATFLCYKYDWSTTGGVKIVGNIKRSDSSSFHLENPFRLLSVYKHTFSTAFLCMTLGYFDSTTAVKALGAKYNYNVSSNRELVALGAVNFIIGLFSGLPSFGALGRSKINILAGARSPMAGIIMSIVSIFVAIYLLPFLYYLPECVLSLTTTIVGLTVLQEIPSDLQFFWKIGGYEEMITFSMICVVTIIWSAEAGVTLGVLVAVARVIKHSTRSRIQILGRIPNTTVFRDADMLIEESFASFERSHDNEYDIEDEHDGLAANYNQRDRLSSLIAEIEDIEGVLIIKIPEPLNFANVGDLKNKLVRIERYGSLLVHPSQPTRRDFQSIKFVIFDCKGMTEIDASATQVLYETLRRYICEEKITALFARIPTNKECREKLNKSGIVKLVNQSYRTFSNASRNVSSTDLTLTSVGLGDGFFLSIDEALRTINPQMV